MKILTSAVVLLQLSLSGAAAAQTQSRTPSTSAVTAPTTATASERRDDWQRVPDIFTALDGTLGSRIADLGAGEGWLTTRLARLVGPAGRVFAADISEGALRNLQASLIKDSLRNVELILSEDDDPRLPYGTLDGVVIVNAYHEMTQRVAVLDGIKRALRPGGRLVIVDSPAPDSIRSRKDQTSRHSLALEFARDDLEAHGFEIVSVDPGFIRSKHRDHSHDQWLLVAQRGKK